MRFTLNNTIQQSGGGGGRIYIPTGGIPYPFSSWRPRKNDTVLCLSDVHLIQKDIRKLETVFK